MPAVVTPRPPRQTGNKSHEATASRALTRRVGKVFAAHPPRSLPRTFSQTQDAPEAELRHSHRAASCRSQTSPGDRGASVRVRPSRVRLRGVPSNVNEEKRVIHNGRALPGMGDVSSKSPAR